MLHSISWVIINNSHDNTSDILELLYKSFWLNVPEVVKLIKWINNLENFNFNLKTIGFDICPGIPLI